MIKVIIAEDQIILRESLKIALERDVDIRVESCVGNGNEAFELCGKVSPDIVLMDVRMPECDGIEGTRLIKEKYACIKVIILTTFDDDESIIKALRYGADGYVLKEVKPDELISVIKCSYNGFGIIHGGAYSALLKHFRENNKSPENYKKLNTHLTAREMDIVRLIVEGINNKEIAVRLFISEGTVKNIITGILDKLDLNDRTQLAVFAVKNDLV